MSNKKEKKTRKVINSFGIGEDEMKNSLIQYDVLPPDQKAEINKVGNLILEDIIHKIKNVVDEINDERLKKANVSSLGTTLKSLVQAYHFLHLHFDLPKKDSVDLPNTSFSSFEEEQDGEKVLEQVSEITYRMKKKWDKSK